MRSPRLQRLPAALYAAAAVLGPIALLVVAWWRISNLDRSIPFALVAAVLALAYVGGATQLRRRFGEVGDNASRYGYEAFAAGAIGALAAGLTMALDKGSLTVALALSALGAAWVTTREPLGLLRFAVGALGVAVAGRLAGTPRFALETGTTPIFNWLLWGYGVPALSFGAASVMLRRQADDQVVALCEALALAFTGFLVMFEIRHLVSGGRIMGRRSPRGRPAGVRLADAGRHRGEPGGHAPQPRHPGRDLRLRRARAGACAGLLRLQPAVQRQASGSAAAASSTR